jgi:NADPH-dependent curcumin reductase CurA
LDAATAKAQQGRQERGQRQLASAGEGVGVIGAAGQIGKGRAVQVIAKIGQKRLCKFTVLRQKSCQPQKKIKQNQVLTEYSGLSSVDCHWENWRS